MNILLCDDDANYLDSFESLLGEYDSHIYKYTCAQAVKESDVIFDIAFLDIVLEGDNLIFDIIDHLRQKNDKCIIAFVTNHIRYAPEGYEYKAFRYILKNEPMPLIKRRIADVFDEYNRIHARIRGSYKGSQFSIPPKDVYYIEICNHILRLYTTRGVFEMYAQMNNLYPDLLDWGFIRCHRSYVVNLRYVKTIYEDSFFVLNTPEEVKIPLGVRYKALAKEKYLNYEGEIL